MTSRLTVLICTHNRAALLANVLRSLNECQRPDSWSVDILVIANACRDGTHGMLDAYRARADGDGLLPLAWLAEPKPGKSHALNRGAVALRGDWVAIVDDDHRVKEDFLLRVSQAIAEHPQASLLCGRILPDWDGREPTWVHDDGPYRIYPLPIPRQDFGANARELKVGDPMPGGGNQIIRVDVLRRLGPFSTELGPQGHDLAGGEDTEYMLRALRAGERLWYVPEIVQYHHVDLARLALSYLMRKAYHRSASAIVLHETAGRGRRGIPLHIFRKLSGYAFRALTSFGSARRRFYLVRSAAALGEMAGYRRLSLRSQAMSAASARSDHA
ncbi:glycosyltransferase family 2 protein [Azohydromonas sediminis]|uniref:glycosyltransferase family 2 protein n=1 Tax=Azohydromonas sediminis TaxID=2259674 RepID=UPI001B357E0E|nr:glycosyltransferase [Azohydromonas sediminis]